MTWMALGILAFVGLVVGGTLWFAPTFGRPDTPLGVVIPVGRLDDPSVAAAIATSVRRFHRLLASAVGGVVVIGVGLSLVAPVAVTVAAAPTVAIAGFGALLAARRGLLGEKERGGWMEGVSRVHRASVTVRDRPPAPALHLWPYLVSAAAIGSGAGYGIAMYDRLPDRIPTHFGADGVANVYSAKGVGSVFGVLFTAAGLTLLMLAISLAIRRMPPRLDAGVAYDPDDPDSARAAREQAEHLAAITLRGVGWVAAILGVAMTAVQVITLHQLAQGDVASLPAYLMALLLVPLAVAIGVMIAQTVRVRGAGRAGVSPAAGSTSQAGAERPAGLTIPARDDDRYWKGGVLYVNRNDPATFVPKRFGIGWTVNAGSRGGMLFFAVLALVLLAGLLTPLLAGH